MFPINIRFKKPKTYQEVEIGNQFTVQMVKLPVTYDFKEALDIIHKRLSKIKKSSEFYSVYLISLLSGTVMPYKMAYWMIHSTTEKISLQFSNIPGPKYPITYKGRNSLKSWFYVNPAAQQGVSLTFYSHRNIVKLGLTTDIIRVYDPEVIIQLFE